MLELKYINQADYQAALKEEITAEIHNVESETYAPYMAEMARADAIRRFGEENIYKLGLKIYTTLDSSEQENAIQTLRDNLMKYTRRHGYRGAEDIVSLETLKTTNDRQEKLKTYKVFANLYPALVTQVNKTEATLEVYQQINPVKLTIKQLSWAQSI